MGQESHLPAFCRIATTDALVMSYINPTQHAIPPVSKSFQFSEMPRAAYRSSSRLL